MNCITKSQLFALSGLALAAAVLGFTVTSKLVALPSWDAAALRMDAAPAPGKRVFCPEGANRQYSTVHGGIVCGTE